MRNQSGEILREVADGGIVQVTNHGRVAALIVPPGTTTLGDLIERGQVRPARQPLSSLRSITRSTSKISSQDIVRDVRGRW
jgi:antitoxin (DNA-binding transcriptional repressor) of toxin-antitoxin stability system